MVVLDATVVNIALPRAQEALHFSDANRQWVITAYTLAFGGLLLFGGRIADLWGRKRAFIIGLIGFAIASALGGAASGIGTLLAARAAQGAFGALLAPAALSLLAVSFTIPAERAKAFGVYGAIAGAGAAVGLILGGVLTEALNWRWVMFVNILFAVVAIVGAVMFIHEPTREKSRKQLDIPGVLLATGGLVALVYGFTEAAEKSWTSPLTISMFVASVVLLAAFLVVESIVKAPLLPLRVLADRNRGGVYLTLGIAIIGMFGMFLFLTFYLQRVLGYSPVKSGFAFMPMVGGMIIGSTQIGARLMLKVPARWLMGPGFVTAAVGMVIMSQISTEGNYSKVLLPGLVLMGLGMGTAFMPAMSLATLGVAHEDAGVASAMVNTSQQVGGSIGTALLNTIAATTTTAWLADHKGEAGALIAKLGPQGGQVAYLNQGLVHGFSLAIWCAAGALVLAALLVVTMVNAPKQGHTAPLEEEAAEGLPVPVLPH